MYEDEPFLPLLVPIEETRRTPTIAACPHAEESFERFWEAYPSRYPRANPKKPAHDSFLRALRKGADAEEIILAATEYCFICKNEDPQFIAMAVTWLNQERWQVDGKEYRAANNGWHGNGARHNRAGGRSPVDVTFAAALAARDRVRARRMREPE